MRLLLNSAVIPEPGVYRYRIVSAAEARVWLAAGPWRSLIGYGATRDYIRRVLGVEVELSREACRMAPGDQALVVRLSYRPQDPGMKRGSKPQFSAEDWEIELIERVE